MNINQSKFYCTRCGNEGIPILRKQGQSRESGHLKKLYCLHCKTEVNHVEIKENGKYTYEDFLKEFNSGRFLDNGTRSEINELIGCTNVDCQFYENGKCWNANNSANCPHKPKKGVDNNV